MARSWRARLSAAVARQPLRWRLIAASLGMLAVLLLGLGALVSLVEESMLLQNEASALYMQARTAAQGSPTRDPVFDANQTYILTRDAVPPSTAAPSRDFPLEAALLVQRLTGPTTSASVLSTTGAPLVTTEQAYFLGPVTPSDQAISDALTLAPRARSYSLATDAAGRRQLIVLLPLIQNGHTVGLLQLDSSTRQIDDAVTTTRIILFSGIAACLMLAGLLSWPLMDRALRPLAEMEAGARRIAEGDLTVRLREPESNDEIGRLARTFNTMVAKVEGAFNRQRRFVADVSHELRTPLTALGGGLEMLLMGADQGDPVAARRLARGMYAETERMRHLVEELLTLARLDEGRAQIRLEAVDVGAALASAVEQAEQLSRGQVVTVDAAPDLPSARADVERLKQVLLILLDNAVKHTPPGGRITLAARLTAGEGGAAWVALEARDTGEGIPAEALPHVFDRFYRVDPARSRSGERAAERIAGSGLGLAIAKGLVEAMDGRIAIASAPGEGTTVTIELPVWRGAIERASQPPAVEPSEAPV
ncbi:MAG TPA: ATP-binding protein [Ktedonobacterales bacterium]|nr:ATP-binding protein [Ktedonobacterales bacterium]